MSVKIYIQEKDVWDFYQDNKARCKEEMITIAENDETQYALFITEDSGDALVCVCKGDEEPEKEEPVFCAADCKETVERFMFRYLLPVSVKTKEEKLPADKAQAASSLKKESPAEQKSEDERLLFPGEEDEVYRREDELICAMCDFLGTVLETDMDDVFDSYGCETVTDILDDVLEAISDSYCMNIYRPRVIDEGDRKVIVDYPYENRASARAF